MGSQVTLGIYEKALRHTGDWDDFFAQAARAGFSFVDLSVDETEIRSARLDWDWDQCQKVRSAAHRHGVLIGGICLSLHRKIMPGSSDSNMRKRAAEVYRKGIDLAVNLGVSVVQVAGYYAYYELEDRQARDRYLNTLAEALPYAAQRGVILAIENVDGNDISAVDDAAAVLARLRSPWLQIYPDIGNIAEHGGDAIGELKAGENRMVALHVKDVLPGEPRRIPLGQGVADFEAAFAELARQNWSGRMMIEMWNDDKPDSAEICVAARLKIETWLAEAGIAILPRK